MSIVVPYFVSVVFYSILYFFATSRIMELVIRISAAPLVAGVSFFGKGANTDIVRYIKRSMGIMFQIVVILVISASVTFIHKYFRCQQKNPGIGRTVSEVRPHPQLYKIFWYAKYKRRTKRIDKKKEVSDALTKMLKTKQLKRRQCPDCGRAL